MNKRTALKGGLSGSDISKAIDASGDVYVFRDIGQQSHNGKIREIHAHITASEQDYGPYLHAYDVSKGKIIISFIDNYHEGMDEKAKMVELVYALKKMHQGPALCDSIPMLDLIGRLYNKISHYPKEINKHDILKVLENISHIKAYRKKPTHRDLNPNNIFFTKTGVKFIDFENAG